MTPTVDPARRRAVPAATRRERDDLADQLLSPEGLTAHASVFDRRHVLQGAAQAAARGAGVEHLRAAADHVQGDGRAVALPDTSRYGDTRYSTVELLDTEQRLLDAAARRRHAHLAVADTRALSAALGRRPSLSDEQEEMVTALTTSGAGVQTVVGVAGSGKTFALDAARDAWQSSGIAVIGAALAARAAAELQAGSGIASTTLDRLLLDAERPGPDGGLPHRGVVVVDEAGMVGTRKLDRLLNLAERCDTAVVLVGDPRQLPEVDAGGAFAALAERLPTIELTANRRQTEHWERAALAELRVGSVGTAVTAYRDHQRITVADSAHTARDRLVADWWAARQDGADAAMYALRRSDVDDLNRRARLLMAEAGRLSGEPLTAAGRRYSVGDIVLAGRNDRRLGILNGTIGQVVAVDHRRHSLTIGVGGSAADIVLPADYLDGGHLDYGYATTIHKARGASVDEAFVLGSDALYREAGYVALSRARTRTNLYTVGTEPDLDDHRRRHDPAPDPIARLADELARSQAQQLASEPLHPAPTPRPLADLEDEQDRLRRTIGPPLPPPDSQAGERLNAARAARQRAEEHLDNLDRLPGRQRAAARPAAERVWGDASAAEWRAQEAFNRAEQDRAFRQQWLTERAEPLAAYQQLGPQITAGRRALETAALADPAAHHLELLGPAPLTGPARHRWARVAADVDTYRQRWAITGPEPLGPTPGDDTQTRHLQRLQHSIDGLQRHLGHDRHLDQGLGL